MTTDNYNNPILKTNGRYELVRDLFSGHYVNFNDEGKRIIVAKFPDTDNDYIAMLFWKALEDSLYC